MINTFWLRFMKWGLVCFLFINIAVAAIVHYLEKLNPDILPPPAAGIPQQQTARPLLTESWYLGTIASPATRIPQQQAASLSSCDNVVYGVSEDGVRYVREAGGGIVYAAWLNKQIGFYELNPYGYMLPVDNATLQSETTDILRHALLECHGHWLTSGVWFALAEKTFLR